MERSRISRTSEGWKMTSPGPKLWGNFPWRVQNWGVIFRGGSKSWDKKRCHMDPLGKFQSFAVFSLLLKLKVMKNPPNDWNLPSFETKSNEKPAKSNFGCLPKRSFLTPWPFALNFEQNVVCECSFLISMSS